MKSALEAWALEPLAPLAVEDVVLYRSELRPTGAVHSKVTTVQLADGKMPRSV